MPTLATDLVHEFTLATGRIDVIVVAADYAPAGIRVAIHTAPNNAVRCVATCSLGGGIDRHRRDGDAIRRVVETEIFQYMPSQPTPSQRAHFQAALAGWLTQQGFHLSDSEQHRF